MGCEFPRTETAVTNLPENRARQRITPDAFAAHPGFSTSPKGAGSTPKELPLQMCHFRFRLGTCVLCSLKPSPRSSCAGPKGGHARCPPGGGGVATGRGRPTRRVRASLQMQRGTTGCEGSGSRSGPRQLTSDPVAVNQGLARGPHLGSCLFCK